MHLNNLLLPSLLLYPTHIIMGSVTIANIFRICRTVYVYDAYVSLKVWDSALRCEFTLRMRMYTAAFMDLLDF